MPFQINTSRWSPSDALKQKVMAAMERDAQYTNMLIKSQEQARKEIVTTEAMSEYRTVAADPKATRNDVYAVTQRAFGRILGVDPEGAKAFADEAALYPRYFPTDQNTTEYEDFRKAYMEANPKASALDMSNEWNNRMVTRAQSRETFVNPDQPPIVTTAPNGETLITYRGRKWNQRANEGKGGWENVAGPSSKLGGNQTLNAAELKDRNAIEEKATLAASKVQAMKDKMGGWDKLDMAGTLYQKALESTKGKPELADKLKSGSFSDTDLTAAFLAMGVKQDPERTTLLKAALKAGDEWWKALAEYHGYHAILQNRYKRYLSEDLKAHDVAEGGAPPSMYEKRHMQWFKNWGEATTDDLATYGDPDNPAFYIPEAGKEILRRNPQTGK